MNLFKFLCLNETIFTRLNNNSTVLATPFVFNDCFLQLILLIPVVILFTITNAYIYGATAQLSRHAKSTQLRFYRSFTFLLTLVLLIRVILKYFWFELNYKLTSIALTNDLFQLISACLHLNLLFNKSIFKNLNFSKYPKGLLACLVVYTVSHVLSFINQLIKITNFANANTTHNRVDIALSGCFSFILMIYIVCISVFFKVKLRNLNHGSNLNSEEDKANYISYITLGWLHNVMTKGYKRQLNTMDDLSQLPYDLNIGAICKRFMSKYSNEHNIEDNPIINPDVLLTTRRQPTEEVTFRPSRQEHVSKRTLISALIRCFGYKFMVLGLIKLANDSLNFAGPLLLNKLVEYIEINSSDLKQGCMYAGLLFFCTLVSSFLNIHFTYALNKLCLKIKCALIGLIYTKTVQIQLNELNNYSIGQIVNFMSIDSDTVVNIFPSVHAFWSLPFQIIITLYLLYRQIGLSFLVGLAFVIILIPINKVLCDYIGKIHQNLMKFKDSRVKMMTEFLHGIRVIKFYTWENYFSAKINDVRESELKQLRAKKFLDAFCVYFWACTPILMSVLTFMTYVLVGNQLTPSKVFTSLALFNMLISPLNSFPWVVSGLVQGWVSLRRLQEYLNLKNLNWNDYYTLKQQHRSDDVLINVRNASFKWNLTKKKEEKTDKKKKKKESRELVVNSAEDDNLLDANARLSVNETVAGGENTQITLNEISFTIEKSKFIGVIGKVGCGKSSLLNTILAEITKFETQSGTIEVDRELLADGFAYAAQDCYIQASTIRDNILFGQPYDEEKYKRVIYACALNEDLQLLPKNDETPVGENGITLSGGQKARLCLARACYQNKSVYLLDDPLSAVDTHVAKHIYDNCIIGLLADKTRILCTHHLKYLLNADKILLIDHNTIIQQGTPSEVITEQMRGHSLLDGGVENNENSDEVDDEEHEKLSHIHKLETALKAKNELDEIEIKENDEEEKEHGVISLRVYKYYCLSIGIFLTVLVIVSLFIMQGSRNATDWWLSYWTQHHHLNATRARTAIDQDLKLFFIVYGSLCFGNSLFTLVRAFSFAYSCILAGKYIHNTLIKNLLNAKVRFFDITPRGRILNRLSSDMYAIDDALPFVLNICLACFIGLLGILAVTCYSLPWFTLSLVPLTIIYYSIQNYYRWTSRELKRLTSVSLSPVYTHFHETINGLVTIRSFREVKKFMKKHEIYLYNYIRASYVGMATSQWLNFRLQMIGVMMITIVGFTGVFQHLYGSNVNASLIGLALSYILSVTGLLNGLINTFTETEKEMVSVERTHQFQNIESEDWSGTREVDAEWPRNPTIEFENVCLNYQLDAPNALDNLTFSVKAGEKIGIVGRTGSGKSSLFMALFRAFELRSGKILIDGVNTRDLDLTRLRQQISIIPQDPFLFSGTLRENLDPYKKRSDHEIWTALEKCRLFEKIRNLNQGLELEVEEKGKNFSTGEKQLVCLARAILSQTKILCIDEATASVDFETDNFIQETIRNEFKSTTVLTIAHRLNTIIDYDKVIVMNSAKIVEFDAVASLMANKSSLFFSLVDSERKQEQQKKKTK